MDTPTPEISSVGQRGDGQASSGLLTLEEAAEILGVHYMTAYRYVRSGRIPARQESGRWIVLQEDLDKFRSGPERGTQRPGRSSQPKRRSRPASNPQHLAEMLESGDESAAWSVVEPFAVPTETSRENWVELLASSMRLIGDRWQTGVTSVAEEHRASVIALRLIGRLGARANRPGRKKGTVLLAAAPGDLHGLPTALAAEALRGNQYNVVDLGADVPVEETWKLAGETDRLLAVGFCATNELSEASTALLAEAVSLVRREVGVPVIIGGAGVGDQRTFDQLGPDIWTRTLPELLAQMEVIYAARKAAHG